MICIVQFLDRSDFFYYKLQNIYVILFFFLPTQIKGKHVFKKNNILLITHFQHYKCQYCRASTVLSFKVTNVKELCYFFPNKVCSQFGHILKQHCARCDPNLWWLRLRRCFWAESHNESVQTHWQFFYLRIVIAACAVIIHHFHSSWLVARVVELVPCGWKISRLDTTGSLWSKNVCKTEKKRKKICILNFILLLNLWTKNVKIKSNVMLLNDIQGLKVIVLKSK